MFLAYSSEHLHVFSINDYLIKGSALTCRYVILPILVASLNRFLLVEIPGTKEYLHGDCGFHIYQFKKNTFRRMRSYFENCFLKREYLILDVKTKFRLQKPHCKTFWWKHIKIESCKCYLGNKGLKAIFLVVFRSYVHFGFEHPLFRVPDRACK